MSGRLAAVQGTGLAIETISGVRVMGQVSIVTMPYARVKSTRGVYCEGTQVVVSNITDPGAGATIPDPGPFKLTFSQGSRRVIAGGQGILREGDVTSDATAVPKVPGSPPSPHPVSFRVRIMAAGQERASSV